MPEPNCLPVPEAARRLGLSPQRVRQLLDVGELAPIYFGGGKRFVSESSLRRLIAERTERREKRAEGSGGPK